MYVRVRYILILAFGAYLCASCQQISTPVPTTSTPVSEVTATTSPATSTPLSEPTTTPQTDPDIEEYAVYNDLLASKFKGADIDQVLIIDHTRVHKTKVSEKDLTEFDEYLPLAPELVASFVERNQQPYPVKPVLDFGMEYQLLTQAEVDELRPLDEASGWKFLYEKYPNSYGFVYLSRVGFNADFSQALVHISTFHYEQALEGGYYLMIRQVEGWEIESSYVWNS